MDRSLADHWIKASDHNCFKYAKMMAKKEGIMSGGSAGANLYAAVRYAKENNLGKNDKVVVIVCDCIRHYTDNFFSKNWMAEKHLNPYESLHEDSHHLSDIKIKEITGFLFVI